MKNKNIIIGLIFLMLSIIFYGILTSFIGQGLFTQASLVERYLIFTIFQLLMIIFITVAFYFIIYKKKETEWERSIESYRETEKTIERKERERPSLKPCPYCGEKILINSKFCSHCGKSLGPSDKLSRLIEKKAELKKQLEDLKREKDDLIKKGLMSEKTYQQRYEEIMDQLVDIEDKIIQEKIKGGGKK